MDINIARSTKQFASVNGTLLAFEDCNGSSSKTPVIFIHGFPFTQEMWAPQIEDLEKNFRVITYDLRGLGESRDTLNQFTMETLVDDFKALLDHLKIDSAIVVGFSMGGYVALRAIEREPHLFKKLVLADTQSAADSDETKLKRSAALKTIQTKGLEIYAEEFLKVAFTSSTFTSHPELVENSRQMICANSKVGTGAMLLSLITRTDTTSGLKNISVPTLIIVGAEDKITPVARAIELQEAIRDSTLEVIPNAGHMSSLENSESFNELLLNFIT